jgi:hypothetical protein
MSKNYVKYDILSTVFCNWLANNPNVYHNQIDMLHEMYPYRKAWIPIFIWFRCLFLYDFFVDIDPFRKQAGHGEKGNTLSAMG